MADLTDAQIEAMLDKGMTTDQILAAAGEKAAAPKKPSRVPVDMLDAALPDFSGVKGRSSSTARTETPGDASWRRMMGDVRPGEKVSISERTFANVDAELSPEERQKAENKRIAMVAGMAGGGLVGMGLKGLGTVLGRLIPGSVATAAAPAARIGQAAAAGYGGAATAGGAEAALEGEDKAGIMRRAEAEGPAGAAFGVGGEVLGLAGGAAWNAIKNSRGGKARQLIEKHGGEVGVTTPGRAGPFDRELAGRKATDRDIGEVSRESAADVLSRMDDAHMQGTVRPHVARKAAIEQSPEGEATRDVTAVYDDLVALTKSERLTPGERAQVESLVKRLGKNNVAVGDEAPQVLMAEKDLNDFRGMLQDLSGVGAPNMPTVAKAKLQKVAGTTKGAVDEGPFADTNRQFSEGTRAYEGQRQLLDLPAKPANYLDPARMAPEGGSEPEIAKLANMLARDQQNTVTAGVRNSKRVERFASEHPDYERSLEMPRVLEAKGDLSIRGLGGGEDKGGLINRLSPGASLGAAGVLALEGDPKYAALPLAAEFLRRNIDPITGRLLYAPAKAMGKAAAARGTPTGSVYPMARAPLDELDEAMEFRRKRKKEKK